MPHSELVEDKKQSVFGSLRIESSRGHLSADSLLSLSPTLSVVETELTREELSAFLEMSEGLHMIKNRWIEVDHEKLKALLDSYDDMNERFEDPARSAAEILKDGILIEADRGGHAAFIRAFTGRIKEIGSENPVSLSESFRGELRPYQEEGRSWLHTMRRLSLGVCLADDMGLGKTVQLLAYLDRQREQHEKQLLIIPASLTGNWEHEIRKFTPKIDYKIYHGQNKELPIF